VFVPLFPHTYLRGYHSSGSALFAKSKHNQVHLPKQMNLYVPRTPSQFKYVASLEDPNVKIVCGVGAAGSGKTLFACSNAVKDLFYGNIEKIIITRPLISVDEENIGFLPGTLNNKMDIWTRPILDTFTEFYSQTEITNLLALGKIEIAPLAYMRGRTFKKSTIIADEMQNSSPNQMLMMTTRIGESSKLVITGDLKQSDRSGLNGLGDFIMRYRAWEKGSLPVHHSGNISSPCSVFSNTNRIEIVEFEESDIQRSEIVKKIHNIYSLPFHGVMSSHVVPSSISSSPTKQVGATRIGLTNTKPGANNDNDAAIVTSVDIARTEKYIEHITRTIPRITDSFDFIDKNK
jgi:phosphate starvation-inducible PhoH-like protein